IPATGHSFVSRIDVVRICRIPLYRQMDQISRVNLILKENPMTSQNLVLQDRLDAFKADLVAGRLAFKPTKERLALMERATRELIESGQAQRAKKAGDRAPEFSLKDPAGSLVSSRELLAKGPLVLSFYRGVSSCRRCRLRSPTS